MDGHYELMINDTRTQWAEGGLKLQRGGPLYIGKRVIRDEVKIKVRFVQMKLD